MSSRANSRAYSSAHSRAHSRAHSYSTSSQRQQVELSTFGRFFLSLCCILPQPSGRKPSGIYVGCCPRLVSADDDDDYTASHPRPHFHRKYPASKIYPVQAAPPQVPPKRRYNSAKLMMASMYNPFGRKEDVVEVTPTGAVIAHAEPDGGPHAEPLHAVDVVEASPEHGHERLVAIANPS